MDAPVTIPLTLIYPSLSGRKVNKGRVSELALSLQAIGLKDPITVRRRGGDGRPVDAVEVVAGRHRYEAAVALGWTHIDAFVMDASDDDYRLWQIDENFTHGALTDAERAQEHLEREAILVRKGLVKAQGRPRKDAESASFSYADQTATALGVSKRTVQQDLARGKKIAPEVLAEVQGTDLDKGVVLDQLAATPRHEQKAKLIEIAAQRQEAQAANRAADRAIELIEAQRFADWLMARTDLNEIDTVIAWIEGAKPRDVIDALRRLAA